MYIHCNSLLTPSHIQLHTWLNGSAILTLRNRLWEIIIFICKWSTTFSWQVIIIPLTIHSCTGLAINKTIHFELLIHIYNCTEHQNMVPINKIWVYNQWDFAITNSIHLSYFFLDICHWHRQVSNITRKALNGTPANFNKSPYQLMKNIVMFHCAHRAK